MKWFIFSFSILFFLFTPIIFAHVGFHFKVDAATEAAELKLDSSGVDEYQLPYPGLLPDNPLYPIKTFRDKVVSLLISDPVRKAEFNLLQADKRLHAGILLIQQSKKHKLAIDTISKGENYLEEALIKTTDAKKQGMSVGNISDKLKKSANKHKMVISELSAIGTKENASGYSALIKRIEKLQKQVVAFKP